MQEEEVLQHPGAHLGIMRMKAPPRRKFLLRLSKQLGDAAWQKSVPPLSLWGGGLGGDGCARVCVGVVCSRVFCFVFFCCWFRPVSMSDLGIALTPTSPHVSQPCVGAQVCSLSQ